MQFCCAQPDFRKFYSRRDTMRWTFMYDSSKNEMDLSSIPNMMRTARSSIGYNSTGVSNVISGVSDDQFIFLNSLSYRTTAAYPVYALDTVYAIAVDPAYPFVDSESPDTTYSTIVPALMNQGYHTIYVMPKKYEGRQHPTRFAPIAQSGLSVQFNVAVTSYGPNAAGSSLAISPVARMPTPVNNRANVIPIAPTWPVGATHIHYMYSVGFLSDGGGGYVVNTYMNTVSVPIRSHTARMKTSIDQPERVSVDRLYHMMNNTGALLDLNDFDISVSSSEPGTQVKVTPKMWKHSIFL